MQEKRILIVDDMPMLRKLLSRICKGHCIEVAADGQEALDAFSRQDFDLIFMDVEMPIMDGLAATRIIRMLETRYRLPHTTIVNISSSKMVEGEEVGMDRYLGKPFEHTKVTEICHLVERRKDYTDEQRSAVCEYLVGKKLTPILGRRRSSRQGDDAAFSHVTRQLVRSAFSGEDMAAVAAVALHQNDAAAGGGGGAAPDEAEIWDGEILENGDVLLRV